MNPRPYSEQHNLGNWFNEIVNMGRYYLGIDVSTTGSTALAVADDGRAIVGQVASHESRSPQPLWSEQDPEQWWQATIQTIRSLGRELPLRDVQAVGLTGQMLGLTLVDQDNRPVRPAILWNDQRSGAECSQMTKQVGPKTLYKHIGSALVPGMTLPKLVWMRNHEPAAYGQATGFLLPKDFVRLRLTGQRQTDPTDAAGTGLFDMADRHWSEKMTTASKVLPSWLPPVCESAVIGSEVCDWAAEATGLARGTPVVGGAGDQAAQAIGCGVVDAGSASITVGSSGVVFVAADRYSPDPEGRWHTFCHAPAGRWCSMGVMQGAAASLQWFRDKICPQHSFRELDERAAATPPGAGGLLFIPYLFGERHPHTDPQARGAFLGLTARHELGHLARAVMEGVCYGLRDLVELARAAGLCLRQAVISGGAMKSPVWRQILADTLNLPLVAAKNTEGAALGAAVLAAVGLGRWSDLSTACREQIHLGERVEPDAGRSARYESFYRLFAKEYALLSSTNHALGELSAEHSA